MTDKERYEYLVEETILHSRCNNMPEYRCGLCAEKDQLRDRLIEDGEYIE